MKGASQEKTSPMPAVPVRDVSAKRLRLLDNRLGRTFAHFCATEIHAGHTRLRREGNKGRLVRRKLAPAQAVTLFRQRDDGTTFRRFIRQRRQLRGCGQLFLAHARQGNKDQSRTLRLLSPCALLAP